MTRIWLLWPGLVLLALAAWLVLRPTPYAAELRAAERLWQMGRSAEARQQYLALAQQPAVPARVSVRLAALALLRGECVEAQTYAARALLDQLRRDEAAQMHLVMAQCAAERGAGNRAEAEWASVDPYSPYFDLVAVLRGEYALRNGLEQPATAQFRTADQSALPEPWSSLIRLRLALLRAADNPAEAQQLLAAIPRTLPDQGPDLRPWLPLASLQIVAQARQLEAILRAPADQQAQLLGQQLSELGLYRLALARFERVDPAAPGALLAQAHAAFMRWQLEQTAAATTQLRELATVAPREPVIATLYATALVQQGALDAADAALNPAEAAAPLDPAIPLVRADVLAARREYTRAASELQRARDIARPAARGRYALALADFYLSRAYNLCSAGVDAARAATNSAPDDPTAWRTLAALYYHCRAYDAAAVAARAGLDRVSYDAGLRYFLGVALQASGQNAQGREQLLAAADLAPASEWRARAEAALGW